MTWRWPWSKKSEPPEPDLAEHADAWVEDEDITGTFDLVVEEGRKKSREATASIERVVSQAEAVREARREVRIAAELTRECAECVCKKEPTP
jgi:hypothetical protein